MLLIQQDPTPDLNPDTLGALSQLMLAQAQQIFVHKAIHGTAYYKIFLDLMSFLFTFNILDNMKDSIVAKLASQCEDLYAECLKVFQRENLKSVWDKDWIPIVSFCWFRKYKFS